MRLAVVLLLTLAGCADPAFQTTLTDDVVMPEGRGGPYGGDGLVHAIAVVLSFEIDGETHGNIGAHCGFDDWTTSPPTALIHVGDDEPPEQTLIRMLHPDQDDEGVSHFGSATYADWRGDAAIKAAFDHDRTLGVVTWDPPSFEGRSIPQGYWLETTHLYRTSDGVEVRETVALRDFGRVPVAYDTEEKMCL